MSRYTADICRIRADPTIAPCRDFAVQLTDYRDLNQAQQAQLLDIAVHPEQRRFAGDIASALYILLSVDSDDMCGLVLLVDAVPRGFMLLQRGAFLPPWARVDAVILSALQIDCRVQGRGLGRFCMMALPDRVRALWPDMRCLMLSVDADNAGAVAFYRATRWVDSGDAYRRPNGFEQQMTLLL